MGLFSKKASTSRPTDAEVQAAADKLNAGRQRTADRLCDRSGPYRTDTAMRILAAAALPAEEDH